MAKEYFHYLLDGSSRNEHIFTSNVTYSLADKS